MSVDEIKAYIRTQIKHLEAIIETNAYNGAQREYPVDGECRAYKDILEKLEEP